MVRPASGREAEMVGLQVGHDGNCVERDGSRWTGTSALGAEGGSIDGARASGSRCQRVSVSTVQFRSVALLVMDLGCWGA